jgi:hypothetical protein
MKFRRVAVWFLAAEAVGGLVWWAALAARPGTRSYFMARGAPETTLLAFVPSDLVLFVGGAAASAYGIAARRRWAWGALCVHAGAAAYAALYCWSLAALTGGDGLLGAVLMTPSLVVPGALAWRLRPTGAEA